MSLLLGLAPIAGARLAEVPSLSTTTTCFLFFAGLCTAAGGFALNDVQDRDRDSDPTKKPIARGAISARSALLISIVLLSAALVCSAFVGELWLGLNAIQLIVLLGYSRIKRLNGVSANFATALLCTSGIAYGSLLGTASLTLIGILTATFLFVLGREVLKDMYDVCEDSCSGIRTIPTILGPARSASIAAVLLISGMATCVTTMYAGGATDLASTALVSIPCVLVATVATIHSLRPTVQLLRLALHGSAAIMLYVIVLSCFPA